MRVAITGGSGFIGHHVAALTLVEGHDVVVVDHAQCAAPGAIVRLVDITDAEALAGALADCDVVRRRSSMTGSGVNWPHLGDEKGNREPER